MVLDDPGNTTMLTLACMCVYSMIMTRVTVTTIMMVMLIPSVLAGRAGHLS